LADLKVTEVLKESSSYLEVEMLDWVLHTNVLRHLTVGLIMFCKFYDDGDVGDNYDDENESLLITVIALRVISRTCTIRWPGVG